MRQATSEDGLRACHCVRHETYKHKCEGPRSSPVARAPTAVPELVRRLFITQAKGGNREPGIPLHVVHPARG